MNRRALLPIALGVLLIGVGMGLRLERKPPSASAPAALAVAAHGEPLPHVPGNLKILTWNLQWFPGRSPAAEEKEAASHFQAVTQILQQANADILCLQEVRSPDAFANLVEHLGHSVQILSSFEGAQQIGIASRLPAEIVAYQEFERSENTPPRGFVFGIFDFPEVRLVVYSVHLKSNVGGIAETMGKREESARQLLQHVEHVRVEFAKEGKPMTFVICGDLNTNPYHPDFSSEQTLEILQSGGFTWTFRGVPFEEAVTWLSDGRYPDASFDHFLIKASEGVEFGRAFTVETGREMSDHRPVNQELRFKNGINLTNSPSHN